MTGRQLLASLLAIAAVALALAGGLARYLRDEIVAPRPFADRALAALDREPVRTAVVDAVAAQVESRVPSTLLSPERARSLAAGSSRRERSGAPSAAPRSTPTASSSRTTRPPRRCGSAP